VPVATVIDDPGDTPQLPIGMELRSPPNVTAAPPNDDNDDDDDDVGLINLHHVGYKIYFYIVFT
jgi:hypothetical protein